MTTNESLTRRIEGQMIDYRIAKRRLPDDLAGLVDIADGLMADITALTVTVGHVQSCFAGAHGMFSWRAIEGWHAAQRGRTAAPVDERIPA